MTNRHISGRGRWSKRIPDPIASLYASDVYHLDAGKGYTDIGGGRISAWVDRSKAVTFVRGGAGNEPLLITSATPSGRNAMQMDSTSRFFTATLPDLFSTSALTVAAVVKEMTGTQWWFRANAGTTEFHQLRSNAGNHQYMATGSVTITGPASDFANYHVYVWQLAAASFGGALTTKLMYKDGVSQSLTGSPNFPGVLGDNGQLRIGQNTVSGGYIADLIWCEGRLLNERTLTIGLGAKHSIPVV